MRDKPIIVAGLVVFLALATFPFWYPQAAEPVGPPPELEPPAGALLFDGVAWAADKKVELESLRAPLAENQISLTDKAELIEGEQGPQWFKWRITDGDDRYLIVQSKDTLSVYSGKCVKEKDYMTGHHMDVLNEWRNAVVRGDDTEPAEINGQPCAMSLTGTCMGCHTSRENFCYKCHEYANVLPFQSPCESSGDERPRGILCWDCHDESKGN